jgi:hypothetical protein
MSVQYTHVLCNEFKLNNSQAVLEVLSDYHTSLDLEVVLTASGEPSSSYVLKPSIDFADLIEWPRAVESGVLLEEYEDALPEAYLNCEELSDNDWNTSFGASIRCHMPSEGDPHSGCVG